MSEPKKFLVEGVGKGSIPGCLNVDIVDDVIQVADNDAFRMCHELARTEGLMVGGSAGLNTYAAVQLANQAEVTNQLAELSNERGWPTEIVICSNVSVRIYIFLKYVSFFYFV